MVCLGLEFLEFFELGDGVCRFGTFGIGRWCVEFWKFGDFSLFGIETVTGAVVFWNISNLWSFVFFGLEPLQDVLKTTMTGRSLRGTIYIPVYIHTYMYLRVYIAHIYKAPVVAPAFPTHSAIQYPLVPA